MAAPPAFDPPAWPDPSPDGTTTIDATTTAKLFVLLKALADYIETQYAACAVPATPDR